MFKRYSHLVFSSGLLISALAMPQPSLAQTQRDLEICQHPFTNDLDKAIRACSAFIRTKRTVDGRRIPIKALAAVYELRALAYDRKKDETDALDDFSQSIKLFPTSEDYFDRGNVYSNTGNRDQALLDYNHAIALNPRNVSCYINRGNLHFAMQDGDDALKDYDKALRLKPNLELAATNRKIVQDWLHNFKAMDDHWKSYLKIIQDDYDYANWSGPPMDVYEKAK